MRYCFAAPRLTACHAACNGGSFLMVGGESQALTEPSGHLSQWLRRQCGNGTSFDNEKSVKSSAVTMEFISVPALHFWHNVQRMRLFQKKKVETPRSSLTNIITAFTNSSTKCSFSFPSAFNPWKTLDFLPAFPARSDVPVGRELIMTAINPRNKHIGNPADDIIEQKKLLAMALMMKVIRTAFHDHIWIV